jgi:hypothetical protein
VLSVRFGPRDTDEHGHAYRDGSVGYKLLPTTAHDVELAVDLFAPVAKD